jgi:hypothetical protein
MFSQILKKGLLIAKNIIYRLYKIIFKFLNKVSCRPREEDRLFDFTPYLQKTNTGWSFEKSIFKDYQPDS